MNVQDQVLHLKRGSLSLVNEQELACKLSLGRPLRVKLGVDPTSADLHLGHSVIFNKLRAFQDLGHVAVLIIGDFTARIGDPSGRDTTRPTLTPQQVRANAETYQQQALKILDSRKTELHFNSEWLDAFMREGLLETLKRHTAQQIFEREDFKTRLRENSPLTFLEMLYPILQGYDSVAIKADVELGGNDQLTNLLLARRMQKDAGLEPQVALTMPLLIGTDGAKKMSKSYGNAIALNDSARDIFGKIMRISDALMISYYDLLTDQNLEEVRARHPMEAKKILAHMLTMRFHGIESADAELRFFEQTFSKRELPSEIGTIEVSAGVVLSELVRLSGFADSRNQAFRLIEQGAVKIDGKKMSGNEKVAGPVFVLQVGKHNFVRVRLV